MIDAWKLTDGLTFFEFLMFSFQQLMVNWWLGLLGSPYEWDCYIRGYSDSNPKTPIQTTKFPPKNCFRFFFGGLDDVCGSHFRPKRRSSTRSSTGSCCGIWLCSGMHGARTRLRCPLSILGPRNREAKIMAADWTIASEPGHGLKKATVW